MTMPAKKRLTTIVSSKGRLVLPRTIRQALGWGAGVRLVVEDTSEGVLLKPEPTFVPIRPEEVFGCLACDAPPRTIAEMDAGILASAEARQQE